MPVEWTEKPPHSWIAVGTVNNKPAAVILKHAQHPKGNGKIYSVFISVKGRLATELPDRYYHIKEARAAADQAYDELSAT